jgi:hypothetical protein
MPPWFITLPFLQWIQFSGCTWQRARFEKDTRYFELCLQKDLLSDWTVVATNGRKKSKLGQSRTIAFSNYAQALEQFSFMAGVRNKRGYHCILYQTDDALLLHIIALLARFNDTISNTNRRKTMEKPASSIKLIAREELAQLVMGFDF